MPTHKRDEGHEVQGSTVPLVSTPMNQRIVDGELGSIQYKLGVDVDHAGGDLILSVYFEDGEVVHERLKMTQMVQQWVQEVHHSKRMRDEFGA